MSFRRGIPPPVASPIEDYALLGDAETAALVSKDGSVDWLALPRFDSPACFTALLGDEDNGRWQIRPASPIRRTTRRYRAGLVLETEWETDEGVVAVIDGMPMRDEQPNLIRIVEGRRGDVPMTVDLRVRFDYGSIVPWVRRVDGAWRAVAGPDAMCLYTPITVRGRGLSSVAEFTVREGDRVPFELRWHPSHHAPPPPLDPFRTMAATEKAWQEWVARCTYEGDWADAVRSSLVVLKGLTFSPTGGIVAAATTSLPETMGGERNWDYRYCWLRDATFTLLALLECGYTDEAGAWRDWLLRAVAGDPSELQIMYGPRGERRLTELELPWLAGYGGSAPVRVGNSAHSQLQLDVWGEVMDALWAGRQAGLPADEDAWQLQRQLLDHLETIWRQPDEGIWEVRGPRRDFTHSKVMAWVAFDRAVRTGERYGGPGPVAHWRKQRDAIHAEVSARGVDDRGVFVQSFGGTELDASLLLVPLVGFLPATDPRVVATVDAIARELTDEGGFVRRYIPDPAVDGLAGREGSFLLCTFWLADCYALQGRRDEAVALFERLLGLRNDVGLLSEQWDAGEKRMLGNFPQAFSHVALIDTATNLDSSTPGAIDRRRQAL
jgi:GH15 family glucan-1,4-alpha-glucosidase